MPPAWRPASSQADFPCCTQVLSRTCCRHYCGGTIGRGPRSPPQLPRPSPLLWRVGFRIDIFGACTVFTLVTARTPRFPPYRGAFLKCFRPFVASWPAPSASGRSEGGRVGISPTGLVCLCQGKHNNWLENRIRPVALGRSNWLFARSLRSGKRAAVIMSLLQSAKLNGHDPYRYLADVLERLPTQPASQLDELLPHHWQPRRCPPATSPGLKYSTPSRCDGRTLTVNAASLRLSPLCPQTMSTLRGLRLASRQNASFSKRRKRSGGRTLSWRTAFAPTRG